MADTGIQYIDVEEFTRDVQIEESNTYYPVTGEGIFDKLMETATKHLTAQYKANRIRKEDYADAYSHIYEVTLQAAMTVWLQKPESCARAELLHAQTEHEYVKIDHTKAQIDLTEAQTRNVKADTLVKYQQMKVMRAQIDATKAETKLKEAQTQNTKADTLAKYQQMKVYRAQIDTMKAETELKKMQAKNVSADTLMKYQQMKVMHAQIENTKAETALKYAQKDHTEAQTKNTQADTLTKFQQMQVMKAQIAVTKAEGLLKAAQTENVKADTKVKEKQIRAMAVEAVLKMAQTKYIQAQAKAADKDEDLKESQIQSEDMKTSLYKRQIEGYDENYKEKILKIVLDAFTVVFSVASEGFKGGIPKVITVSGINDLCDIITKDLNKPATNTESEATWVEKIRNDINLVVPDSYSTDTSEYDPDA